MDLQLTNEGKKSINRQNIESVLTLSETGGKLTLIELSIAEKMHCFSRHVLLTEQVEGKLKGLGAQFRLGTGTGGAFTVPFAHSSFPRGIDGGQGCQGYRLRVQNDVKLKVKRLNRQV